MKYLFLSLAITTAIIACNSKKLSVQEPAKVVDPITNEAPAKTYSFESVPNDPMNTRIYTLENGLKVYLSVYKNAPRIQTYIAVGTGSKNDPTDATGLAHYLEHMLFKGTDEFGTMDYEKEKNYLDQIEELYEVYRATKDQNKRVKIYAKIDSVSNLASQHSIANEYDKMLANIGAKGTNAYTWVDQTVYVNDIPANQIENWLNIESERFQNPVLRIFHTELEAVYEEKNRGLDSDGNQVWEQMFEGLFPEHRYGTQTTIGTIEHLKNPSITKIKAYLKKYYIPNNVALCLSGDLDPDQTIALIDETFGTWKKQELNKPAKQHSPKITNTIVKEVFGPEAEELNFAYRFEGAGSKDVDMIKMVDMVLSNSMAGLIDLNLNKAQKVIHAGSFVLETQEYSAHMFSGSPKEGQSLEEVRDLIHSQIDLIKKGEFDEAILPAIINDFKLSNMKALESNSARADKYVTSFINEVPLSHYVEEMDRLSKITKQEIVEFVNDYYNWNYVIVFKRKGERPVVKVDKPAITPVAVNRDTQSKFVENISNSSPKQIEPVFVDFKNTIQFDTLYSNVNLHYVENTENATFDYYMVLDMGKKHDPTLGLALSYLPYLGTDKLTNEEIQKKFFYLGCSYSVSANEDQIYVSLSGLTENFERALVLLEDLINNAKPDEKVLENLVSDILKKRQDQLTDRRSILWGGLYNYAIYGAHSPQTNVLSEKELKAIKGIDLTKLIKSLPTYKHKILYYGSMKKRNLVEKINMHHKIPRGLMDIPSVKDYTRKEITDKKVYVVDYDMEQAEVIFVAKGQLYDEKLAPKVRLYNEYFGAGMSSIVFQDMRESKALAYSVYSVYRAPNKSTDPYYNLAYIGTQADKLGEAMSGMMNLLTDMPVAEQNLNTSKIAIEQKIRTERITKSGILFGYESAQKQGTDRDLRKDAYEEIPTMSISDLVSFQEQFIKGENYNVVVIGDKDKLDLEVLSKYGEVEFLSLETIFGYGEKK